MDQSGSCPESSASQELFLKTASVGVRKERNLVGTGGGGKLR
jgi:hypothetical protein